MKMSIKVGIHTSVLGRVYLIGEITDTILTIGDTTIELSPINPNHEFKVKDIEHILSIMIYDGTVPMIEIRTYNKIYSWVILGAGNNTDYRIM